ncbi:hypothetical protein C1X65_00065 [Pseudomonas sp. FW305-70]|nr:hypothetical protein C1X65_00065 [Pseudomonas sp. FW305-70]
MLPSSHQHRGLRRNCGSGLAREGGVSVESLLTGQPLSRASPLPQKTNGTLSRCHLPSSVIPPKLYAFRRAR